MEVTYLGREDFRLAASFGGEEVYPDLAMKAAVLCWHLVKNHPLPDGNKRVGYLCMVAFLKRNGLRWRLAPDDPDAAEAVIRGVAAGTVSREELCAWVRERTGEATREEPSP